MLEPGGWLLQESDTGAQAADAARLKEVIGRCGALASERPKNTFSAKDLETDLGRLLKGGNIEQHRDVLERPLAASALAGKTSVFVISLRLRVCRQLTTPRSASEVVGKLC